MTVQKVDPPKGPRGYRYETGLETIRKIVNKFKSFATPKPVEGLVPLASRPPNDILNQPAEKQDPNYCENWYFGCPFCFKYEEGDPEVQAALRDDVLRSFIFPAKGPRRYADG